MANNIIEARKYPNQMVYEDCLPYLLLAMAISANYTRVMIILFYRTRLIPLITGNPIRKISERGASCQLNNIHLAGQLSEVHFLDSPGAGDLFYFS